VWSAIFGLVGVVLGAFLSYGLTYLLERRRERRMIRGVARLVQAELFDGMMSAGSIHLYKRNQPVDREIVVEDKVWRQHRGTLSEHLGGDELSELEWAQRGRRELIDWLEQKRRNDETLYADDFTATMLDNFIFHSNRGWRALAKAAGISWRERRRLKREHEKQRQDD
jgi:hypothetical protein